MPSVRPEGRGSPRSPTRRSRPVPARRLFDRSGRRDGVELVRVVEDARLGGPRRCVVMRRDRVQHLRRCVVLLDQPQPEVDVAEQPTLVRRPERRPAPELAHAADVVEERGGEQEVAAQALMQLRELAADRRDADGVLEQPAGVRVMRSGVAGYSRSAATAASSRTTSRSPWW